MPRTIHRILVAIKNPEIAEYAVAQKAAQLARRLNAELCLYHALTGPLYVDRSSATRQPVLQAEAETLAATKGQLERIAESLRSPNLKVRTEVSWDYPSHDAVIRAAHRGEADLVVVDCTRHTHVAPWFLHFTDWELLRNCPVPVLLVKTHAKYEHAPVLAALDPEHTGGKPASLDSDILDYGSALASALSADLHAVHAYNPIPQMAASETVLPQVVAEIEQQADTRAHEALDPLLDSAGVTQSRRHIEEGFTVDVIERVIQATSAQILIMGSVSRTGLKGLLMGNTAERMLDRVGCDMLIVKPLHAGHAVSQASRGAQIVLSPLAGAI